MLTRLICRYETRFRTSEWSGVARLRLIVRHVGVRHVGKSACEVGEFLPFALIQERSGFVTGGPVHV